MSGPLGGSSLFQDLDPSVVILAGLALYQSVRVGVDVPVSAGAGCALGVGAVWHIDQF